MSVNKKKNGSGMTLSADMFAVTDPDKKSTQVAVCNISINKLLHFKNHPFKLYEGEHFTGMVESVKLNGIIMPIIIRPLDNETYEILSGHNRVEAAKSAGLESVPAIIHEDLNDEEALLIVTETNLIQRSFMDLSHSERAVALAVRHEAIKSQGKRTDLIDEIESLLKNSGNISNYGRSETSSLIGKKLKTTTEKVGQQYGLSKNSVARYLRINKLFEELKKRVDEEEIPIYAAVEISYLSDEEQRDLNIILNNTIYKIDIKKAALLREFSESNKLTPKIMEDILSGVSFKKKNRSALPVQSLKIKGKTLSKYFKSGQTPDEIEAELIAALEFYRAHN